MSPVRPQAAPTGTGSALQSQYDVATAGEAGDSFEEVVGALLERIGAAAEAERAVLVVDPGGEHQAYVASAWSSLTGRLPPGPPLAVPDDPASLGTAFSLPDAVVVQLTAHERDLGWVVLDGPIDEGLVARLCVPAGLVLDAALRIEDASSRAARADRLSSLTRDLMSIVSHELRTPLTSVIGSLQTLQRAGVDPASPEGRRLISSALSRAERLRSLVDDLLVTARSESGVRSRHRPVDVTELVRAALASVPGAAPLVTIRIDPAIGPILLDRSQLERVLVNLLDNAVRHGQGPVELGAHRSDGQLVIAVVDHGPGVPPTITRAVLDRRYDSPDAALRPAGPGLGLTVTRALVEGMGGLLRHEPTPGGGATFIVEVPYRDGR